MNRLFVIMLALGVMLCGCSQEDDILPDQRKKLVSYLTSTHSPQLIPEDQVLQDGQKPYYSVLGSTVYRYIANAFDPDRVNWAPVLPASTVTITFSAYVFSYKNIVTTGTTGLTMPYFSNDASLAQALYNAGLTPGEWKFEPLVIDLRRGEILKGLRHALVGCREGDVVEAYMTYNMAYGEDNFSVIPRESPIAIFFTVDSVE